MKLKIFDIHNAPKSSPKGKAFLHVSKAGVFTINKPMVEQYGLKEGQHLKLAQDEARPKDWYLIPVNGSKDGFPLRKKSATCLLFNSAGIKDLIFQSAGCKEKTGRIAIGSEPVQHEGLTLIPLITSTLTAKTS